MENKIKHLEMIQTVVNRMATNSFMIKGWSVTLVSALFAIAARDANPRYVLISFAPATIFWILDGYFLFQEKLYRKLYDNVRLSKAPSTDFSMKTTGLWDKKINWPIAMFSITLLVFHGIILITVAIVKCHLGDG